MALTLTRKHGESILIIRDGETLARITVTEITRDRKVKLSFEASKEVRIMREEILARSPTEK